MRPLNFGKPTSGDDVAFRSWVSECLDQIQSASRDERNIEEGLGVKQPLDATLTALAGLNSTAGLVEQTGADAFTKRLIGVANTTDIPTRADGDARWQTLDAELTAIAGLVSAANKGIQFTGSGTAALINLFTGVYTPTIANTTNVDASTANSSTMYFRIGDMVVVSGTVNIDCTAAAATVFTISLPVASNFFAVANCGGAFVHSNTAAGRIIADITNDVAQVNFVATSTANSTCSFIFMYLVL